jgi:hypothetical protein
MAKAGKKLEDFFGANRRQCTLVRGELLRSKGNEKRMKLNVSMLMSETNLAHCPEPFLTQFAVMEKQDSALNRARIDVEFDSMAVRIFSTDTIVEPAVNIHGALLHKFAMVGEGTGEKRTVSLDFLIYLPATEDLYAWNWDAVHGDFYIESVKAQGSLDLSGEVDDDDMEEPAETRLTQPPEGERIKVVPPPAAKSGPRDLAAEHKRQLERGAAPTGNGRRPGMRPN